MHLKTFRFSLFLLAVLLLAGCATAPLGDPGPAPLMTTGKLRSHLSNPNLTIIDVRTPSSYANGKTKIPGAVREDPSGNVAGWASNYPKDGMYVLYCD